MAFNISPKLPHVGLSIFPVMTALARKHNAVNLAQGFPGFGADEKLLNLINDYTSKGFNQYAPLMGVPALREKLAEKIEKMYGYQYDPEQEIVITAGATQAIYSAISAIVKKHDEVIIIEPAYDCYEPSVILNHGTPIRSQLNPKDYSINWNDIKAKISSKTRCIIINTPHNPTGTIWTKKDMKELEKITKGTDIIIISDEVYEHMVFDGERHESVCRYPELAKRSFVVYSFGKTYHLTGWRLGYVCAPKELIKEFVSCHQFQVYTVNTPLQHACADYSDNEDAYLELNNFFQTKRDFFLNCVSGSKFNAIDCKGTYFQLLDYGKITTEDDRSFADRLTIDHGIASIPISVFFHNKRQDNVLRFCFAKSNEELEKGAEALHKV